MTFSVDFISDLHQEWWEKEGQGYDYAAHKKNDIIIVAGDLAGNISLSLKELKKLSAIYETVLFIDGNHEFRTDTPNFRYNFDFDAVEKELRDGIATLPNVTYLADQPFIKDGVAIIGRNAHWDYTLLPHDPKEMIERLTHTMRASFEETASFSKLARRDYYALRNQLTTLSADDSISEIVVVTHTVPRAEFIDTENQNFPPAHQTRMGSGLMRNLLNYDVHGKVKTWLYGHQHHVIQPTHEVNGVAYHLHPRGRPHEGSKEYAPRVLTFPKA